MGLDLLLLVINTALGTLATSGKVPQSVAQLVAALGPIITNAINAIKGGQGNLQNAVVALGALAGTIEVLKAQTNLDPDILAQINVYDQAIQAGINGYLASKNGVDLSALGPVEPIK